MTIEPILFVENTLRDAVHRIEAARVGMAVVVDVDRRLLASVTDGDIRRAILAGHGLEAPITVAMHRDPVTATVGMPDAEIAVRLDDRDLGTLPLVDAAGRFIRVIRRFELDAAISPPLAAGPGEGGGEGFAAAVIMAGGEGRRLAPLTRETPKPMLEVGGMPLLERIVRRMVRARVPRLYISVNYLGHVIESHFGDGAAYGVEIAYLREDRPLGTAGALGLLPERPDRPVLVVNGDVVTACDYGHLLRFHQEQDALVTVGAMNYRVDIPYGVVRTEGARLVAIEEKPSQQFLCNAGIYALAPQAFDFVPAAGRFDMTDLIAAALDAGRAVGVFPIHEYWADIGNKADLDRVQAEIHEVESFP